MQKHLGGPILTIPILNKKIISFGYRVKHDTFSTGFVRV